MEAPEFKQIPVDIENLYAHYPSIAPKADNTWGVYCQTCSEKANDYIKCSYLDRIPNELVAKE